MKRGKYEVFIADDVDREVIYQHRYTVFSEELGQHPKNDEKRLTDQRDSYNTYLVVKCNGVIVGFSSITPPHEQGLSVEQHIKNKGIDYDIPKNTYEGRLLTVINESRGSQIAMLLMLGMCKWISKKGGASCIALGRSEVMGFYEKFSFQSTGIEIQLGEVSYHLMNSSPNNFERSERYKKLSSKHAHCIKF